LRRSHERAASWKVNVVWPAARRSSMVSEDSPLPPRCRFTDLSTKDRHPANGVTSVPMADQQRPKRLPPAGKCDRCGEEVSILTMSPGQRCPSCGRAAIRSRMSEGDWQQCETCEATGFVGSEICAKCGGKGWFDARKR